MIRLVLIWVFKVKITRKLNLTACLFSLIVLLTQLFSGVVYAQLSPEQLQALSEGALYFNTNDECGSQTQSGGSVATTLTGNDNEQMAYNFFVSKGLNTTQAASVVGNLMTESTMDPTIIQSGGNTDDPSSLTLNTQGWGIAQWTPGDKVLEEAQQYRVTTPIYELATQLTIVWDELSSINLQPNSPPTIQALEQTNTTAAGVLVVLEDFEEGPVWPGATLQYYEDQTDYATRLSYANQALSLYSKSSNNSGTTSSSGTDNNCGSVSLANCSSSASSDDLTDSTVPNASLRQELVCIAEAQLQLWQSQPGYDTANFPYANAGYLDYSGGVYEEWCADFVSWIYNQTDHPLQPDPNWQVAGVDVIMAIAQQGGAFSWHLAGSGYIPQPGDLAVHSFPGQPHAHVNMFISSSGGVSTYIGGDQEGGADDFPPSSPQSTPGSPPSESIVSIQTFDGYWGNDQDTIIGYVAPN
jgi:hypothetical protein